MDEVKAMTHAGETVGKTVGTGLRNLRRGAEQIGQAGVEAVRAATAETQAEVAATSRKARKQLAKDARKAAKSTARDVSRSTKRARKDVARSTQRARKHAGRAARDARDAAGDLIAAAKPGKPKRRAKWPWLLAVGVVGLGAGAAVALRGKQTSAPATPQDEDAQDAEQDGNSFPTNGSAPHPRPGQPAPDQVNHRN
jgi:F0F1-type ATP synthase membrane subunit b/b'